MSEPNDVDMSRALEVLDELRELLVEINGTKPNIERDDNRARARFNSRRSRELLYAGHLCDRLKVAVIDEYYVFRGVIS